MRCMHAWHSTHTLRVCVTHMLWRRELFTKLHADLMRTANADVAVDSDSRSSDDGAAHVSPELVDEAQEPDPGVAKLNGDTLAATADATVDRAIVLDIARRHTGISATAALRTLVADMACIDGANAQVTQTDFVHALGFIFAGVPQKPLADILARYISGDVAVDPAGHLHPVYQLHVKAQPLYARVPWIRAAELQALFARENVSEVIGVDCRTEDEVDVRF